MEGVARHAVADQLGIHPGAPRLGVLVLLQNDDARALAHDEAVAILVVRPRRLGRPVVEADRERAHGGKSRHRNAVDRRLAAARHHDVGVAERNHPPGVADGV